MSDYQDIGYETETMSYDSEREYWERRFVEQPYDDWSKERVIPEWVRRDHELMLLAVDECMIENKGPPTRALVNTSLMTDKSFALAAIRIDGRCFRHFPKFWNHAGVVYCAVKKDGTNLKYVTDQTIKSQPRVIEAALSSNGMALEYLSSTVRNDHAKVLKAVCNKGGALRYASACLQDSPEIVTQAMRSSGLSLRYASQRLRDTNATIAYEAIHNDPMALQYAPFSFRDDVVIVQACVIRCWPSLAFASDRLRVDRNTVLGALLHGDHPTRHCILRLVPFTPFLDNPDHIKNDPEIFAECVKSAAYCAPERLPFLCSLLYGTTLLKQLRAGVRWYLKMEEEFRVMDERNNIKITDDALKSKKRKIGEDTITYTREYPTVWKPTQIKFDKVVARMETNFYYGTMAIHRQMGSFFGKDTKMPAVLITDILRFSGLVDSSSRTNEADLATGDGCSYVHRSVMLRKIAPVFIAVLHAASEIYTGADSDEILALKKFDEELQETELYGKPHGHEWRPHNDIDHNVCY